MCSCSGKKIQDLVGILFWLSEFLSVMIVLFYMTLVTEMIWLLLVLEGLFTIFNYIVYLFLFSWGTLVNNSDKMIEMLTCLKSEYFTEKNHQNNCSNSNLRENLEEKKEEEWYCYRCGARNPSGAEKCIECLSKKKALYF